MEHIVELQNVGKRYPHGEEALTNINFTLKFGEMAFLTGHSGAGKSTLLKLIAAIIEPSAGEIKVAEQNISHLTRRGISSLRRSLGMVFQDSHLLENYTVFDNVALPLNLAGFSSREITVRVRETLGVVGLLEKSKRYPETLSVGERQRVSIARAVVTKPPLLLADEPTGNLDHELALEIMNLFIELNKSGISLLIATHDLALIAPLRYRILTLKKGALLA